jgi:hypothetical protein
VIPPSSTPQPDPTAGITMAHNLLDAKFCTVPATAPDPATYNPRPISAGGSLATGWNVELFPFTSPYKVYAGRCTWADPARYGAAATPFSLSTPAVAPGGSIGTMTVREPATNIRVTRGGSNRSNAYIFAYPTGADCNSPTNAIKLGPTQSSDGKVQYPGLPFGDYEICAQYTTGGNTYKSSNRTIQNRTPTGTTTVTTLDISTSTTGTCTDPTPPPPEDGT